MSSKRRASFARNAGACDNQAPPGGLPLTLLPPSPSVASAPRRRYAKKVGDKWGVTNDGGDFPIYFLTFAGLAAVTYFTLVVVPQL